MFNIFQLIQNENMKIYKRLGTWIMVGAIIGIVLIGGIVTKFLLSNDTTGNWQQQLEIENAQLAEQISEYEDTPMISSNAISPLNEQLVINEYRLANEIPPVESETLWGFMISSPDFTALVSVFVIVIAAGIVATEFSTGTIKLLLIRPVRRSKILFSKYIATLIFALFMLATIFVSSVVVGSILFGFAGIDLPYLVYQGGEVVERNMLTHIISLYGLNSVDMIMMVTFAFMISTVFRSSSLAIGLSLFLLFTGQQLVMLLSQYDWAKYILFANTNLRQYISGAPIVEGMTMTFSMMVLLVYFICFHLISWVVFKKRDVTA
ncbi:ABC transporter permease [Halalkalibacter alkaliphilus]|uniref:ABC transporter permease n=1 Tax=Halalkalibacter alkaliphilus TaxID=2917993 RepID=A0A9X2A0F1_9BACI|nr:ABC transporter permease subunit [Halalkalibacter alkaliphilus]MCL7745535.1 ABC transporter permease [Halalkalibacter alkaliphilus]